MTKSAFGVANISSGNKPVHEILELICEKLSF